MSLGTGAGGFGFAYNVGTSTLSVTGDFSLGNDGFLYNGDSSTDAATLTVGGSFSIGDSSAGMYDSTDVYNYGASSFTVNGNFTLYGGYGNYFDEVGGTMSVGGAFDTGSANPFSNDLVGGVFNAEPGSSVTTDTAIWEVQGGGQLDVAAGAGFAVASGGTLLVDGGGSVTDQGNVTDAGNLNSAALSTIVVDYNGGLTTQDTGQLNIQGTLLTWNNPAANIHYGTALSATQLDATANVPGTFTYTLADDTTPANGAMLNLGNDQTLNVAFMPNDTADYSSASAQVSINVIAAQATPTVSVNPVNLTYGTALDNSQLTGSATVNGHVIAGMFTYTSAAGDVLDAGNSQSENVTFTPNDATDYATVYTTVTVNVAKADQTITVTQAAPGSAVYGTSFTVAASASSGLAVSIAASGAGMVSSGGSGSAAVQMTSGTGTAAVTFTQAGDANYNPATAVVEDVTAQKANQTITVTAPAPLSAVYNTSFTVAATASSGLTVAIAASGVGSGGGSGSASIHMNSGTGTAVVTFTQAGNANYNPATMMVENVNAQKATSVITWSNPSAIAYFTPLGGNQLDATANVSGTFVYSPPAGTLLSAGTHTLSATFTPTDGADYKTATATVQIVVLGPGVTVVGTQLYFVGREPPATVPRSRSTRPATATRAAPA